MQQLPLFSLNTTTDPSQGALSKLLKSQGEGGDSGSASSSAFRQFFDQAAVASEGGRESLQAFSSPESAGAALQIFQKNWQLPSGFSTSQSSDLPLSISDVTMEELASAYTETKAYSDQGTLLPKYAKEGEMSPVSSGEAAVAGLDPTLTRSDMISGGQSTGAPTDPGSQYWSFLAGDQGDGELSSIDPIVDAEVLATTEVLDPVNIAPEVLTQNDSTTLLSGSGVSQQTLAQQAGVAGSNVLSQQAGTPAMRSARTDSNAGGVLSRSNLPAGDALVAEPSRYAQSAASGSLDQPGLQSNESLKLNTAPLNAMSSEADQSFKQVMSQTVGEVLTDSAEGLAEEAQVKAELNARANEAQSRVQQNLRPYTTSVPSPVGDAQWSQDMSEKVVWLTSRNIQSAQIHLNPAELGPVEVKVSVQNDQTVVSFNVQNTQVRELLEANVHRLREMMDGNGVNLADVNVDQGDSGAQEQSLADGQSGSGSSAASNDGALSEGEEGLEAVVSDLNSVGIVDAYA